MSICGEEETQSVLRVRRVKPALLESVPDVLMGARVAPAVACRGGRVRPTLTDVCFPSVLATWVAELSWGRAGPSASNPKDHFCFVWDW